MVLSVDNYVNLHSHTSYSLLDGLGSIDDYMKRAAELGMPALAQTDHGNLYGWLDFYEAGQKYGVKPILGVEQYLARKSRHDRDTEEATGPASEEFQQRGPYHITLLAQNYTGYKNIIKLSSEGFLTGYFKYPRIDLELLDQYSEGVIALSGCLAGALAQPLMLGDREAALKNAGQLQDILGKDNFYIEVMNHGIQEELDILPDLVEIADKLGAKIVPTQDSHYVYKEDSDIHDLLLCIATAARVDDEKRFRFNKEEFYLRDYHEMLERFGRPGWLKNTLHVADSIDLSLEFGELHFPDPILPEGREVEEYFEEKVWEGIKYRYGDNPSDKVIERANHEIRVIKEMGFPGYFIVVADIMEFCHENDIMTSPGRGSAASSIVSYAMKITQIDPLEYDLPFERFLVEGRTSLPDIDIDINDQRRSEVVNYVRAKYGEDHVAHIGTFSQTGAKQAIRDVARVMGFEYSKGDEIAKLIPDPVLGVSKTIEESLQSPDFAKAYHGDEDTRKIVDAANRVEGVYRHTGIHAAGVIISKKPVTEYVPVMQKNNKDGSKTPVTTQWDMNRVEQCGQLKVDFLGLRNLSVLDQCLKNIEERTGEKIDIYEVPLDDPGTYEMLCQGQAIGLFQIEGGGLREMTISLQPENIRDIMALISLYRPGPMGSGMDKLYIARKHGRKLNAREPHPALDELFPNTYGIMLYQEQLLSVAREIAGFSALEADTLRKCLPGHMKLLTRDRGYMTMQELASTDRSYEVQVIDENSFQTFYEELDDVWSVGDKEVFKITTSSGYVIEATANHELLRESDWTRVEDLKVGDLLAVSSHARTFGNSKIDHTKITLAALLIANGYLAGNGGYFCSKDEYLLNEYASAFEDFFGTAPVGHISNDVTYLRMTNSQKHKLKSLLGGFKKAGEKTITNTIINASNVKIRHFLGLYISCDGWTDASGIHVSSKSEQICRSIKRMLLRLGVLSTVYSQHVDGYGKYWKVSISNKAQARALFEQVGQYMSPRKKEQYRQSEKEWTRTSNQANTVGVPTSFLIKELDRRSALTGKSKRELGVDSGGVLSTKVTSKAMIGGYIYSEKLKDISDGDMIWDPIVSIESVGVQECYDFRIKNPQRPYAVVDDVVAHNSVGKKKLDVMKSLREKFVAGAVNNSDLSKTDAEQIFSDIEYFGGYGFNRCLTGDTLIATVDGKFSINEIAQKLDNNEKVYGYSLKNDKVIIDECVEVIDAGIQEVFEITMEDGSIFEATLDHKFLCEDGVYHTVRDIVEKDLDIVCAEEMEED